MESCVDVLELLHIPRRRPDALPTELVVRIRQFQSQRFLDIRECERSPGGDWYDTERGVVVRLSDLHKLAHAVSLASCIALRRVS